MAKFWINAFVKPEKDPLYRSIKELRARNITDVQRALLEQQVALINQQTKSQKAIMDAQARAESRKLQGYTYQEERAYDVAERVAQNEVAGEIASLGTGFGLIGGMAAGVGGVISGVTGDALRPISNFSNPLNTPPMHPISPEQPTQSMPSTVSSETSASSLSENKDENTSSLSSKKHS